MSQLEHAFRDFHERNPKVYQELLKLARDAKRSGRETVGIKMLWEVARWNLTIATTDPEFKLNNNLHAYYARLLMEENPELAGLFRTRELRAA